MFDVFFKGVKPVSESKRKCNCEENLRGRSKEECSKSGKDVDELFDFTLNLASNNNSQRINKRKENLRGYSKKEECGKSDEEVDELFNFNLNIASNNNRHKNKKRKEKRRAKHSLREALISEALLKMLNESMGIELSNSDSYNLMKRNLVESFVAEKDPIDLLEKFKYTSVELANISFLCEEYVEKIFETVEDDDDEYMINSSEKRTFFDKLKGIDTTDITDMVSARVTAAISDFTYQNKELKDNIQDLLQKTQETISSSEDDDIKESASLDAKREMNMMKDNRTKTIFESMVEKIAEASLINESMSSYKNESGLDMIKIVENTRVMYTFMELLNTAKIEKIDESYVKDVIDNLK